MRLLGMLSLGNWFFLSCSTHWWVSTQSSSVGRDEEGGAVIACVYMERENFTNPLLENDITNPGPGSGLERCLLVFLNTGRETLFYHDWTERSWTGCPADPNFPLTRLADGSYVMDGKPLTSDGRPANRPYRILSISPSGRYRIIAGGGRGEHRLILPERVIELGGYDPADWSPSGDTLCRGPYLFRVYDQGLDTLKIFDSTMFCLSWGPGSDSLSFGVRGENFVLITDLLGRVGDTLWPQDTRDFTWLRDTSWYIVRTKNGASIFDRRGREILSSADVCQP